MANPTDNPAFEFAIAHTTVEPDIYFDETDEDQSGPARSDPYDNVRLIFATCLQAAFGDLKKLHSIMGSLAGLPLREVGRLSGISHESVRIHLKSIEHTYPHLHRALVRRGRLRVDSLVPILNTARWKLVPVTGKPIYVSDLKAYCRLMKWSYETVRTRHKRGQRYAGFMIERLHAEPRQGKVKSHE